MKKLILIFTAILFTSTLHSQNLDEKWVPVSSSGGQTISININGLSAYAGDDFFVWALFESNSSISVEGIEGDIHKVKTYYHINRRLNRYSIEQVLYYDGENNVLKFFNYEHKFDRPDYIFNNPVIAGSDVANILIKCNEYLQKLQTESK